MSWIWDTGFMCCMCFEPFGVEDAYEDGDGQSWDICKNCSIKEMI